MAVYFDSELKKLKLQTYQSISPAKVREKPPDNAENRENGVWRKGKFPSLAKNATPTRRCFFFVFFYSNLFAVFIYLNNIVFTTLEIITKLKLYGTRRLAACTQAVVILRSTSHIAVELNVLHFNTPVI